MQRALNYDLQREPFRVLAQKEDSAESRYEYYMHLEIILTSYI